MQRLRQLLDSDQPVLCAWCGITDSHYIGTIAEHDFDAVVLDMQHGFWDEVSIQSGISTLVAKGKAAIVRIPLGRWDLASRAMDFGALGIIAPMINNATDAAAFASATRFIPLGDRSFGPRYAASLFGITSNEYLEDFDRCSLALAMVETREAYNNLDQILEVKGIDGVLIGPSDLSISFRQNRIPDPYGDETIDVIKDIIKTCQQAGKRTAAFTLSPEPANMLFDQGVDLITVGLDQSYISDGIKSHLAKLKFR